MSTAHPIEAQPRDAVGSRQCKKLRDAGRLPAVLYGHKEAPAHLSLDAKEALSHIHAGEKVFELRLPAGAETAILKDLSYDHLGVRILHADFERVNLNEEVSVQVHLHLVGDAKGLKHAGALLVQSQTEIIVRCTVRDLRDSLDVDISGLDIGHPLHAGDIALPARWALDMEPESVLAMIQITKEEAEGEEVAADTGAAEPEVLTAKQEDSEESKE